MHACVNRRCTDLRCASLVLCCRFRLVVAFSSWPDRSLSPPISGIVSLCIGPGEGPCCQREARNQHRSHNGSFVSALDAVWLRLVKTLHAQGLGQFTPARDPRLRATPHRDPQACLATLKAYGNGISDHLRRAGKSRLWRSQILAYPPSLLTKRHWGPNPNRPPLRRYSVRIIRHVAMSTEMLRHTGVTFSLEVTALEKSSSGSGG
jgi:hypothetical protein